MKVTKNKGKGKVHPSLSPADGVFTVLKLLPAAILILVSVLSLQDREVLAFLITRSLNSTTPSSQITGKNKKKLSPEAQHKTPAFDCDCFSCYTSYWSKWDTSPNREIITQAIEAFDEHLNNDEQFKKRNRGKKRDKTGRRKLAGKSTVLPEISQVEKEQVIKSGSGSSFVQVGPEKPVEISSELLPEAPPEAVARSSIIGMFTSRLWNFWGSNV